MSAGVTVAIPVRDGARFLEQTLTAVLGQKLPDSIALELLVCDSGSRDDSIAIARAHGAKVIEIPPWQFSHGGTRNLMMECSDGDHVAFLSQDAVPDGERWLARLLDGFSLAHDTGLAFGPYRPRADASPMVARELTEWFRSFSPSGAPRIDRLAAGERDVPARELLGHRGFFTDANGCVARTAWERVPFRMVPYAEDHVLAHDMLRAGYAKVFLPDAGVIHSHDYSGWGWLRRSFDEARAVEEVYAFAPPLQLSRNALQVRGLVGADWRWARRSGQGRPSVRLLALSLGHHTLRTAGTLLGARARRLPDAVVRRLSLEQRSKDGDGQGG